MRERNEWNLMWRSQQTTGGNVYVTIITRRNKFSQRKREPSARDSETQRVLQCFGASVVLQWLAGPGASRKLGSRAPRPLVIRAPGRIVMPVIGQR